MSPRGFTLIEIMAASVIIVLVAIGTLAVYQSGANLLTEARLRTESALLVQEEFESLINACRVSAFYNSLTQGEFSIPQDYALSNYVTSAQYEVVETTGNTKTIRASIRWEANNKEFSEEFYTTIINPDIIYP
jgi:prepilin-type N-terminal cleavage/methylation domain-containing protein